jgi:hypothetical protein
MRTVMCCVKRHSRWLPTFRREYGLHLQGATEYHNPHIKLLRNLKFLFNLYVSVSGLVARRSYTVAICDYCCFVAGQPFNA